MGTSKKATDLKKWAEDPANHTPILNQFFSGLSPGPKDGRPRAIFTAGIPGAGKSELADQIIREFPAPGLVLIDPDQISRLLPKYSTESHSDYRPATSVLVGLIFDRCLGDGWSFLMDSTLSYKPGRDNVSRAVEAGWQTTVYYVVLDPRVAYGATQGRERIIKRRIGPDVFGRVCHSINASLMKIFDKHCGKSGFTFVYFDKGNNLKLAQTGPEGQIRSWYSNQPEGAQAIKEKLSQRVDVSELSTWG